MSRLVWQRAIQTTHRWNLAIKSRPVFYATGVATLKAFVCDVFIQSYAEGKTWKDMDYPRVLFFSTYGFLWLGIFHYWFYCKFVPRAIESRFIPSLLKKNHTIRGIGMTFIDLGIYSPFLYFPVFYVLQAQFYDGIGWNSAKKGFKRYWPKNFISDNCNCLGLWIPSQLISFIIMPAHLRIPWMTVVSFFWTLILSYLRGPRTDTEEVALVDDVQSLDYQLKDFQDKGMDINMIVDELHLKSQLDDGEIQTKAAESVDIFTMNIDQQQNTSDDNINDTIENQDKKTVTIEN